VVTADEERAWGKGAEKKTGVRGLGKQDAVEMAGTINSLEAINNCLPYGKDQKKMNGGGKWAGIDVATKRVSGR